MDAIDYPSFLAAVYEKFHALLAQETTPRGLTSSSVLQMVPLGMPIDPEDFTNLVAPSHPKGNLLNSQNFARLCNAIPKPGPYYERSLYNVEDVYNIIVHGANVATQRTFDYTKYLDLLKQVQDLKAASGPPVPIESAPSSTATRISTRWQEVTDVVVQSLQSELEGVSLSGRDAISSLFFRASRVFEATRMLSYIPGAPDWHITYPTPDCWADPNDNDAYRTIEMTSDEVKGIRTSAPKGLLDRFSLFPRAVAEAARRLPDPVQDKEFTLSFSYCFVYIERPWLETHLFRLGGGWYLSEPFHRGSISSGDLEHPGDSTMTLLPWGFIAVKDLTIRGELAEHSGGWLSRSARGLRSMDSLGPFSLRKPKRSLVGNEFKTEGTQIIAWLSETLPVVPPLDPPA